MGPEAGAASGVAALKVEGNALVADGRPVDLRGINWGWWHLAGTRYSEADMANVARWGANTVRLAFSYNDLETDDLPPVWKEQGFKDLDEVAQWARRYGIHLILDMHVVPGGQSTAPYCAGGRNLLWQDAASQQRFVELWSEIARRYRDRPEVAAYELMNEPGSDQKGPDVLRAIDQRAIDAIRVADPAKTIVVGGDRGSGPGDLTDEMKFSDPNILYTFHWYVGAGGNEDFIGHVRQESGLGGTQDWVQVKKSFQVPPGADHMSVVLRSISNTGSAWFDDVEVVDAAGQTIRASTFDQGTDGFRPEAFPNTKTFDFAVGHSHAGSLKISGTSGAEGWAGWVGERLPVQPGQTYQVTAWTKLNQATGDTHLAADFFRINTQLDGGAFRTRIQPAVAFARKYNVPVWVGEFGCDASDPDMQIRWVNSCVALFEQSGFHWTYWNDKETTKQNGMGLQAEFPDGSDRPVNARLLAALRAGWKLKAGSP